MSKKLKPTTPRKLPATQGGAALATALVMLLVLTIVGVSAFNTIALEETMAGNLREQNLALQAVESAIRDAEINVAGFLGATSIPTDGCTNAGFKLCDATAGSDGGSRFVEGDLGAIINNLRNDGFWSGYRNVHAGVSIPDVYRQPEYIIDTGFVLDTAEADTKADRGNRIWYDTITARAFGNNPNTIKVVQATFGRRN